MSTESMELVPDPVSHISISGVHGGDELNERLAVPSAANGNRSGGGPSLGTLLVGAAAGAALMYLFDPDRGARRRSLLRDQLVSAFNRGSNRLGKTERDLRNRAVGLAAQARGALTHDDADDAVVVERVRAELGRIVSHPGAITVAASNGEIMLAGDVLAAEVQDLVHGVRGVRGVERVSNHLTIHQRSEGVPSLQGESTTR